MCLSPEEKVHSSAFSLFYYNRRTKRSKLQVHRLITNQKRTICHEINPPRSDDIMVMNIKLYLENQTIVKENEKLRKTADLLHRENLALFSDLQKKLSNSDHRSMALFALHK